MARDQRRLAAIVSADVAGYSRLMGKDESGTLEALTAHRRELIDPKIAEYGGRIVKTTGDGLLLEFPSVVEAVRCAVELQRGMVERNAGIPADERIEFRVGVNVGDIIIQDDDIFGDGVNVAARLQTLADPGEICASKVVRDQVLDKLSFVFENQGSQQVKNIARPIEVYRVDFGRNAAGTGLERPQRLARDLRRRWLTPGRVAIAISLAVVVALGGYAAFRTPTKEPSVVATTTSATQAASPLEVSKPEENSVAVLPFANLSDDKANEYFSDGISEELLTVLQKIPGLRVAARTSAFSFKGKNSTAQEIGEKLNVANLVEGSVRRRHAR